MDRVNDLPLKKRIALCSGKDEWRTKTCHEHDINAFTMSDGPNGLRKLLAEGDTLGISRSDTATCFPVESTVACSFDTNLLSEMVG